MDYSTKTLAKGCFGKIYKQKYKDTWTAMKKVPTAYITKEQLDRECRVYYKVHHNNVVKLLGDPWLENGMWHIPLEFIFGEDLETTIFNTQKSQLQLSSSVKATIISGMCEGLFHLHSKDIVHQDLKPDNIMVEHQTHRAVIIDMGLAKFFVNGLSSAQNLGNEAYSAPEILHRNGIRDKRSDVWALGKIIAELCAGIRLPTDFLSSLTIRDTLKDNPYCSIVSKMVAVSAAERPTMIAVIGEIRREEAVFGADTGMRPMAGMGKVNTGLGVQGGGRGKALNDGAKQIWHFPADARFYQAPPGPLPADARFHQSPPGPLPADARFHQSPPGPLPADARFHQSPPGPLPADARFHQSPPGPLPADKRFYQAPPGPLQADKRFHQAPPGPPPADKRFYQAPPGPPPADARFHQAPPGPPPADKRFYQAPPGPPPADARFHQAPPGPLPADKRFYQAPPGPPPADARFLQAPPGPPPADAQFHQVQAVNNNRGPSPKPEVLLPFTGRRMVPQNSKMNIPCPLPSDGRVIQHCYDEDTGQMVYKEIVTRHGRVVKYEDVLKMTKP